MVHLQGAGETGAVRLGFDRRVRLEFHGSKISSDGGLLLFRELDQVLGLHDIAGGVLRDTRTGDNRLHTVVGLLWQSVFGRLAGYDDVNDADRLALDPVMRQVVGGRAVDPRAASASQMGRFETEVLATAANRAALADLSGQWIDRVHSATPPKWIALDRDSSVSPTHATHGAQEGTAWNGHFGCMCSHPLFVFNPFGHLERCALRPGNVHSADGGEAVLKPVIARYAVLPGRCCVRPSGAIQYSGSGKLFLCHPPPGQSRSSGQDCASAQARSGSSAKRREASLQRLSDQAFCVCCGAGKLFADLRRFWAVAARRNSSFAPQGPGNRNLPRPRRRLRWAKSLSTFFPSFIEMSYWRVLAISRATWRASSCSSRVILRASAFGQPFIFDGQA